MVTQIKGLVLGDIVWGEHDKLMTVLTAEHGKITVVLKGGSSLKSKIVGACLFGKTDAVIGIVGYRNILEIYRIFVTGVKEADS